MPACKTGWFAGLSLSHNRRQCFFSILPEFCALPLIFPKCRQLHLGVSGVSTMHGFAVVAALCQSKTAQACQSKTHRHIRFMIETKPRHRRRFFYHHSLTIVSAGLLTLWIVLYSGADPATHLGSFFGNSIADWSGSLVIILGTKYLLEFQSAESRRVRGHFKNPVLDFLWRHSLLIFLGVTGVGWAVLFWKMDANSKWGQVVGNIVSEWVQMAGLVFLTKRLIEKGSKESH